MGALNQREDVVAPLAFGGGFEHFHGVIEAEQAFEAGAITDGGVERVEDAQAGRGGFEGLDAVFNIGGGEGFAPCAIGGFDLDCDQGFGVAFGPIGDFMRVGGIPEFADFGEGSKAEAGEGGVAEAVDLIAVIEGLGAQIGGEDALCEVVNFGEAVTVGGGEFAGIPQVIKGLFMGWAAPHFAGAVEFGLECVGGEGAFIGYSGFDVI